jgi:hypothetical protein
MGEINIANSRGRDAVVSTQSVRRALRVRWLDEQGRPASTARVLRATLTRDLPALERAAGGLDKVAQALIAGDPEVDLESFGRFLHDTSRVYLDPDGRMVHKVIHYEIVRNPDGTERERRPRKLPQPNLATEIPLKWTGRLMKKAEVYNRFVFSSKIQIVHVNGLTFDFLYGMARELEEKDSLMLVGGGPKGNQPLVLQRGGAPYRGFLEGRTQGDKYCLLLHLSNMELKAPGATESAGAAQAG